MSTGDLPSPQTSHPGGRSSARLARSQTRWRRRVSVWTAVGVGRDLRVSPSIAKFVARAGREQNAAMIRYRESPAGAGLSLPNTVFLDASASAADVANVT